MTNRERGVIRARPFGIRHLTFFRHSSFLIRHSPRLPFAAALLVLLAAWLAAPVAARAGDPEGCLVCHRYRGLARVEADSKVVRLFYVAPDYYDRALGPHARLKCTDCHDRKAVEVIPHRKQTPVDCTKSCHLTSSDKVERKFDHGQVAQTLKASIHAPAAMDKANELLGTPLAAQQARCLLCHDEPTYRLTGETWAENETPIGRCGSCHDARLPVDTRAYYWHVMARVRRAHSSRAIVTGCALCHRNQKVRDEFKLPDSVASYLTSFHGKATLLGDQQTANCLDCHIGQAHRSHDVRARKDADSPINPANVGDTCRTPRCHPRAGKEVTSAAIHLELSTSRGIEYLIACAFILMILTTFGPSLLLTALEMLQVVVGRHDPAHHTHLHRLDKVLAQPRGPRLVRRFTPHQRVQHWVLVISFSTLAITGFPMKFADSAWASWVVSAMGGLYVARIVHRVAAVVLMVGFLYHAIYVGRHLVLEKRRTGKGFIRSFMALPMMMSPADMKHMMHLIAYLIFLRKDRPETGRFSPEEKFEYFGVFWGTCLLSLTGILMWANSWTTLYLPGRALTLSHLVHSFEAFLALLHVGVVHMVAVLFGPHVFPCSPAMFTGNTPADEMAERHAAMIADAEGELGLAHAETGSTSPDPKGGH
ncbi:MAG: cytochrome b/b6 domain-containing protein [Phycisphaerae bacterium]|nr:cytochrome b/b6 domain-containing protein [Phycisphaerae bacterium]